MGVCDCYRQLEPIQLGVGECLGAKNKPRVDCDGEESRCLFYSDRRRKAKVKTNADRIRSMTDEELAEFIGDDPMHDICPNNCYDDLDRPCKVCALDWLREAKE